MTKLASDRRLAATETARNVEDIAAIAEALRSGRPAPADILDALAHRYLASARTGRRRIDPAGFAEIILSELTGRFLYQDRRPVESQAARMLAAALRRAAVDIEDRTHFVPCRLFDGPARDALAVGPVVFQKSASFRNEQSAAIATDPEFAALIERDFMPWEWVATVEVKGCDRVLSRRRGLSAVDGALDILRLFAGAAASASVGRAGAPGLPSYIPAGLWADSSGRLHPVRAEARLPRDSEFTMKQLFGPDGTAWREAAGVMLRPLVDPALVWPLAARFREAASWFGEGVTEVHASARILAFVTAIERAVVVGDHAGIWRTVTLRAAILAHRGCGGDLAKWSALAETVYEIRSRIAHGAMSPFAPEAGAMAPGAARLAQAVLRGALDFFGALGRQQARCSADRLERAFRMLTDGATAKG